MYYDDKLDLIADLFGASDVRAEVDGLRVDGRFMPIVDDVIVALDVERLPPAIRARVRESAVRGGKGTPFAPEIQRTFGQEWTAHPRILPEHRSEFDAYFDLVQLDQLEGQRVADLGCGIGRWSYFVADHCREIVLVDYSEAVFVARRNLQHAENAIFVMADVLDLPFRYDAFDLAFCLGVLHHLPVDALDALRQLRRLSPRLLVYLYYALDNRPFYYRWLLDTVTPVRKALSGVRSERARSLITGTLTLAIYAPIAQLGRLLVPLGLARFAPLAEAYAGKSFVRLRQDAYDRFFTSIEQRFTREQILSVSDSYASVTVSENVPYWHFLCERDQRPTAP